MAPEMNQFDLTIINFLNRFSCHSWTFDNTLEFISENHLIKGAVLISILWWGWFRLNKNQLCIRIHVISTILGCFLAMAIARSLVVLLPFRPRPLHNEGLNMLLPYGMKPSDLEGASSLPSDHAVLFYALSAGMFFISGRTGVLAIVYTTLFIAFPRVYLGLHYPTDILLGAAIGIAICLFCNLTVINEKVSRPILGWSDSKPELFYPVFFLISYQIADLFENSRDLFGFVYTTLRTIIT
ncbi:MAG: phosphatase PAP2 family protein [Pseudomonadota bacterium]